jgi:hypothetical protein
LLDELQHQESRWLPVTSAGIPVPEQTAVRVHRRGGPQWLLGQNQKTNRPVFGQSNPMMNNFQYSYLLN